MALRYCTRLDLRPAASACTSRASPAHVQGVITPNAQGSLAVVVGRTGNRAPGAEFAQTTRTRVMASGPLGHEYEYQNSDFPYLLVAQKRVRRWLAPALPDGSGDGASFGARSCVSRASFFCSASSLSFSSP